jgi:hypothetical protein
MSTTATEKGDRASKSEWAKPGLSSPVSKINPEYCSAFGLVVVMRRQGYRESLILLVRFARD